MVRNVSINEERQKTFEIDVHKAIDCYHYTPNPRDMLWTSLASCFESTLRMIGDSLNIVLKATKAKVIANIDVRGTLMVTEKVPVGFHNMLIKTQINLGNTDKTLTNKLFKNTEHCCVIFQTLKTVIPVYFEYDVIVEHEQTIPFE